MEPSPQRNEVKPLPASVVEMPRTTSGRLRLASIEITQRCNLRCPYCEQPRSTRFISVARFKNLLTELAGNGVEAVALGGGEPTLHPSLPDLLQAIYARGLRAGLTTNGRDPRLVLELADQGLLESFGVSAGKGQWLHLASHPMAIVNLLLLRNSVNETIRQTVIAVKNGARRLLLLGYKGGRPEFRPTTAELCDAYTMLNILGRRLNITIAADDYTRRCLGLTASCGEGFLRVRVDGGHEPCCFEGCKFRAGIAVEKINAPSPLAEHLLNR